jgi:hypothetical protein
VTCSGFSSYGDPYGAIGDQRRAADNVNVLVEPPTIEPLTLDEAKLRCGVEWPSGDPREAQLMAFVKAARERVERDTGYALLTQTRDLYLSHLVNPHDFPAPARPLQSIGAIPVPDPPPPPDDGVWPPSASALYPYTARIVVGWPTVADIPPLLVFAVGLLTAHYQTAGRDAVVVGTIATTVPLGYEEAISDFARVSV